ncbi:nucleolar complex protein 14 [Lodderomyces elongisporus]|uniref:nucleolar complex protein 14 n=1 Tax=Lodderomyces elongisporus TaxID=36914 RepID=UPI00291FC1AC|nr:nucleolar complex protein 14 [Lodderomyces elongisporus]WLF79927.1 nucleolar complex protein 14 [Lodderomyces elongisporus]
MAGSQLKQLKSALKEKGLIGQTNTSKKSKKSKTSRRNEIDRDLQKQNLLSVRDQFNKFDQRINRTKHDITITAGGEFVKVGSKQHNATTAKKGAIQKQMKMQYDLEKRKRNRVGGVLDKRFGENDMHMTQEEKMLARFTRERQAATSGKKRGIYSLESDDDDGEMAEGDNDDDEDEDGGFQLTHSGQALSLDDEETVKYVDEDQMVEGPPRKKTKAEVMKEVIAKSKFYKQQRQRDYAKTQNQIDELDEDFGDIMDDLRNTQKGVAKPQFSTKTPEEIAYDNKVRELTYDRRAVPADRTKTDEELQKEHEEKIKKLEQDRLRRMEGFVTDREAEGDDLGEDLGDEDDNDDDQQFWGGESENEEDGFTIKEGRGEGEEEEEAEEDNDNDNDNGYDEQKGKKGEERGKPVSRKSPPISMPTDLDEFKSQLKDLDLSQQAKQIQIICDAYKPHLAMGNKDLMNKFVSIIFEYVLFLADEFQEFQPILTILKKLASQYNEQLVERMRVYISDIESRINKSTLQLKPSDLAFFIIVGFLFSTSDHYHLIVTPCLILINQILSNTIYRSKDELRSIAMGIFLVDVLLTYQRIAKRFDPEIINFIEFAFLSLVPEPEKVDTNKLLSGHIPSTTTTTTTNNNNSNSGSNSSTTSSSSNQLNLVKSTKYEENSTISFGEIFKTTNTNKEKLHFNTQIKSKLLIKLLTIMDKTLSTWRDKSSIIEILESFIAMLKHFTKYTSLTSSYLTKFSKLLAASLQSRQPLQLQHHKSIGIATYTPKFEENFNPDKKSYDINVERQQLAKVKAQLKKEHKAALKDIRYENRFLAREQIGEKKQMYDEYHRKMARIVNTIQADEGKEKNDYEREKKQRKSRK